MPTPKSKRIVLLQSSNHDSEFDSLRDAVADSQNESTQSDGADTLLAGYSADNGSSDGNKLKQLRPLGQQLFSSQEESGETIPVASDITLTSEPPVVGKIITVTNTNDRGPGSLRNAVAPSQDGSNESATQDILTGGDYPEVSSYGIIDTGNGDDSVFRSTLGIINTGNNGNSIAPSGDQGIGTNFITGGNGIDSLVGNGQDTVFGDERLDILIGNYSEPSRGETEQFYGFPGLSISGNNTSRVTSTGDGYSDDNNSLESAPRDTLHGGGMDEINFVDGSSGDDSPNRNDQTLIEPHTDQLFSSGVGSLEITIFLPAVQKVREAAARSSGASSNDGAWALGSTFELTSEESFSSQTETSGRTYIGPGGPTFWPPRPNKEVTVF